MADYDNSRHIFENCHSLNPMCLSAFQPIIWQYGNSFHKKIFHARVMNPFPLILLIISNKTKNFPIFVTYKKNFLCFCEKFYLCYRRMEYECNNYE